MERQLAQRKNLRLQGYDCSLAGGYFITMAAKMRGNVFGIIENEEVVLNEIGLVIQDCWLQIPRRFPTVLLDEFILMPDHFHAILFITEPSVGAGLDPARGVGEKPKTETRATTRVAPTLGQIIGGFKSISTNQYFSELKDLSLSDIQDKLWQRSYYDRIIRNEDELNHIRNYMINNPINQKDMNF